MYAQQDIPKNYMVHYNNNNNNNNEQFMYALEPIQPVDERSRTGRASKFVMAFGIAGCCILFTAFIAFFIIILLNEQGYIR
uniref:Uncharacterized protein n=1 Tax=Plectus sambesii TaxID=2011161 RepID=A0A914VJ71_9BILA